MDFVSGRLYFIKDEFFEIVGEEYLKMNKDDTQRPHYYTFKDENTNFKAMDFKYKLIDINKYDIKELLNRNTMLANVMILEKCMNT